MPQPRASAAKAPDRRERRKAETRARLVEAARELFVAKGYHATRPQDIARAADVAAGTFYVHFADKREAFLAFTAEAADELMDEVAERAARRPAPAFRSRLAHALGGLLDYADRHPGVLRVCFADEAVLAPQAPGAPGSGASLRERLASSLAGGLREAMARGEVRSDYDPTVIAHGIVGLVQQALIAGSLAGVSRARLIDDISRFCGAALAPAAHDAPTEESR